MKLNDSIILQAKEKSIISYLESIAIPVDSKKSNRTYAFFRSPFRNENDSSFAVNIKKNIWKDYGNGEFGDIISLVMKLEHLSYPKAIERLIGIPLLRSENMKQYTQEKHVSSVKILSVEEITNKALLDYLSFRKIDIDIARTYCKEVECDNNGRLWKAIGFPNDRDSWELRSKWIKIALAPKDISTIDNNKDNVRIFEGFTDFLSFKTYQGDCSDSNFIILNSVSMVGRVLWEGIKGDKYYYGDNDKAGDECIRHIPNCFDRRTTFAPYKDFNEFLVSTYVY